MTQKNHKKSHATYEYHKDIQQDFNTKDSIIDTLRENPSSIHPYLEELAKITPEEFDDNYFIEKARELTAFNPETSQWREGLDYIAQLEHNRSFSSDPLIKEKTLSIKEKYGLLKEKSNTTNPNQGTNQQTPYQNSPYGQNIELPAQIPNVFSTLNFPKKTQSQQPKPIKQTFECNDCETLCEVIQLYRDGELKGIFGDQCKKYFTKYFSS